MFAPTLLTARFGDALGRLKTSTIDMAGTVRTLAYEYDANGNRTRLTYPGGQSFSYAYDGLDRMKGIDAGPTVDAGALASIAYDTAGRRSSLGMPGATMGYGYDGVSRLTGLTHGFAAAPVNNLALTFGYNPATASRLQMPAAEKDTLARTAVVLRQP
jgi:YD repeat-containing protein